MTKWDVATGGDIVTVEADSARVDPNTRALILETTDDDTRTAQAIFADASWLHATRTTTQGATPPPSPSTAHPEA